MKRFLAAFAAATLLTACSSGTGSSSGSGDDQTLTIASVDQGSIEKVVDAFKAANPGVTVNLSTSGADQYQQQIRTQLSSGTAPDVMTVWPGNGNPGATYVIAKPGYLRDLSDQPWAAQLPDAFKQVAQYDGKTYNALFGLNGIGAVYNDEALTKSGLTAPGTWTDLLAFCKAAAGKGTPAFALGIQDNWVTQIALYALVATTVYSADKDFDTKMAAGQATFAGSPWTVAMAKYEEMSGAGCFQKDPLGTSYEASQTLAATGKTLGIIQGNWIIGLLKGKNPAGTFSMKALPATDDAAQFIMPAAAGAGYGVNAKAKNPDLALKFVNFVMSPEGMKTFNEAQGSLPTLSGAGTTVDPGLAELTSFVEGNKTVPFMDQLWPNAKVQQTMLSGLQEVFSNQATAADVLADMDTDYKAGA
ncbi:raffinose/stachyose/melibiose transport system substrate-binding protein [Actinoplanes lutulentus]|uniref:Carbohydrate ABC transporter substrate-binding protein (CUT1 family) n=1 Tax=Actinoplanes lutulentus TaxID=1287878 RepID=A0A327ZAJ1_9ACTN|nr:extracellular solute-binding protein [Actinoplanes lutulentus]MBB2947244.1 raffinose/stachyose/melibiose transport system substrate-binding protein [Actinoplanes lutulentus]RAK36519.1 carbohydrate ABC transporter substrate-binding protein (CUT1 family) [Actinoplanes lutulentus]